VCCSRKTSVPALGPAVTAEISTQVPAIMHSSGSRKRIIIIIIVHEFHGDTRTKLQGCRSKEVPSRAGPLPYPFAHAPYSFSLAQPSTIKNQLKMYVSMNTGSKEHNMVLLKHFHDFGAICKTYLHTYHNSSYKESTKKAVYHFITS